MARKSKGTDLAALQAEATKARERWAELRGQRADRERELQQLRAGIEVARREAKVGALVPGGASEIDTAELEVVEGQIRELEAAEREAEAAKNEAETAFQAALREQIPQHVEAFTAAKAEERKALAELGKVAERVYREVILPARGRSGEAQAALDGLLAQLGGDRRDVQVERGGLRGYLRKAAEGATAEEVLGYLVAAMLDWSRKGSSPVDEHWREAGVPVLPGSVLHGQPIGDQLHVLRAGRLPG